MNQLTKGAKAQAAKRLLQNFSGDGKYHLRAVALALHPCLNGDGQYLMRILKEKVF